MDNQDEYIAELEAQLEESSAKIYELEAKTRRWSDQVVEERRAHLDAMKRSRDAASQKLKEIRSASDGEWVKLMSEAEQVWNDLRKAIHEGHEALVKRMRE